MKHLAQNTFKQVDKLHKCFSQKA